MCGFAGEFVYRRRSGRADVDLACRMAQRLRHRGPDQDGRFASDDGRCAMGFRRLCVIDPSGSPQPMTSDDGTVALAFNGEIYNFRALRESLARSGHVFHTAGDTEVLLAMYLTHGLAMLDELEGMFAAAIYDGRSGKLHLVRDRMGVKPLWYAATDDRVVFASEAKALHAHPAVASDIDPNAVAAYLTMGYVPAPASIWTGAAKLPPASTLTFDDGPGEVRRWWRPPARIEPIAPADAVDQVRQAIRAAVAKRLVADVPIGALLSGGIDSSIVSALMCEAVGDPAAVRTFSVGFAEAQFDERPHARRVAEHLGTDHREFLIEPDAGGLIDTLVAQYDEPFGDSSALPTYLLCQAVRAEATVALVGDGGDEAFAGYDRHRAMRLSERITPATAMGIAIARRLIEPLAPRDEKSRRRRFVRFAAALNAPPAMQYLAYRELTPPALLAELATDDFAARIDPDATRLWFCDLYEAGECDSELQAAQRCDVLTYLPDDLLVKADIASMAHGLELRSPLLDHHVMELGLSLPDGLKVAGRRGKRILAEAFADKLPAEVFSRAKAGFGVPIGDWLAGPLLGMLKDTLLDQSFIDAGFIKRTAIERMIDRHVAGKADHRHRLWALLCLGRWLALRR